MIERSNKRKVFLQETAVDTPPSTDKEIVPPMPSITPPTRSDRRTRLAELANRVGQWLEDEVTDHVNNGCSQTVIMIVILLFLL